MKFPLGEWLAQARRWARANATLVALALAVATAGTVGVGVWLDVRKGEADPAGQDITVAERVSTVVYQTAQVMLLNMEPKTGSNGFILVGRVFAVLFVVFLGFQAVRQLLGDSLQNFRLMKWRCWGRHHVVCGLGRIGWPIVKQLHREGRRVLVIERDPANERIDEARRAGAVVLVGDTTQKEVVERALLGRAAALYVVTGSDDENIEAVIDAYTARQTPAAADAFRCYVHLLDPGLGDVLGDSLANTAGGPGLRTFNVIRNSARRLIVDHLTAGRPRGTDEVALYVIVGFGPSGQTMATYLAELAHFENRKRARVLILADNPATAAAAFLSRWGQFSPETVAATWDAVQFDAAADDWAGRAGRPRAVYHAAAAEAVEYACNAVFAPCPASMADRGFVALMTRLAAGPGVRPAVIFCHETDKENYAAAMTAERSLRVEGALTGPARVRLFAWLPRQEPLKQVLLQYEVTSGGAKVRPIVPFGSCSDEVRLDALEDPLEDRVGLEINAGFSDIPTGTPAGRQAAGAAWRQLSETDRHSNRMAAVHVEIKLACLGYRLVPPTRDGAPDPAGLDLPAVDGLTLEILGHAEHNRWMAERLLAGTSHGPKSNSPPRRPTLRPAESLPPEEAAKDRDQIRTVFATLQRLNYRVRPTGEPPARELPPHGGAGGQAGGG